MKEWSALLPVPLSHTWIAMDIIHSGILLQHTLRELWATVLHLKSAYFGVKTNKQYSYAFIIHFIEPIGEIHMYVDDLGAMHILANGV